jgi:hypothetical protein
MRQKLFGRAWSLWRRKDFDAPTGGLRMENTAAELLDIIKRNAGLTIPELVARTGAEPSTIATSLEQLRVMGLINVKADALTELRGFADDINTDWASYRTEVAKRIELLNRTSRLDSLTRRAILTPNPVLEL